MSSINAGKIALVLGKTTEIMNPQGSNPSADHGTLTVLTSNEIECCIFPIMFLHGFVARTDLYLCWRNRSGSMNDNGDNASTRVKPKDFDGVNYK